MDEISVLINTIHGYFRWRRGSHDAVPFLAWEKDNARKKGQLTFAEYLSFRFFLRKWLCRYVRYSNTEAAKNNDRLPHSCGFFSTRSSEVMLPLTTGIIQRACKFEEAQLFFQFPKKKMIKMPRKLCAVQYVVGVESR